MCYVQNNNELLSELRSDLSEGLISINSIIGIDRDDKRDLGDGTHPIIDYFYEANQGEEVRRVSEIIKEMKEWNSII